MVKKHESDVPATNLEVPIGNPVGHFEPTADEAGADFVPPATTNQVDAEPAAVVAEIALPAGDAQEVAIVEMAQAEPGESGPAEAGPSEPDLEEAEPVAAVWPPAELTTTTLLFVSPPLSAIPRGNYIPFDQTTQQRSGAGGSSNSSTGVASSASSQPQTQASHRSRTRRRGPGVPTDAATELVTVPTPEPINEPVRVKGSTRLEAKKLRRREGREGTRRRSVITETEFLARREAVDRKMVVRSKYDRVQIAVLEDDVLVEHYIARSQEASLIGNIYLGRVQNVLPSMEAAFVDIGRGRNAVLYSGEVDWDAAAAQAEAEGKGQQPRRIELALKAGDRVLVQVTKDPVGHKGARLTSQISLPGRYLVYVPNGSMSGISRKLPDTERARLKRILKSVLPEHAGVIVRTAAEGATEDQLVLDVTRLASLWENIAARVESAPAPALLHAEPDLLVKIIRDVFNEDFQCLIIEGEEALETITAYVGAVVPDLLERVTPYEGIDSFAEYRITEQIEKALDRKVWLPSGGSLVIDRTEAMTVIDVNTGKFVGVGGNLEETVTKNNLEAAEEIVRQLRLRDIGGIIVVDFIDMVLESNRDLVQRRLIECLSRDRTKHQVAEVTSLGLVQMTRKKIGLGLLESFSEPCETCAGRGVVVHHEPVVKLRAPDGGSRRTRSTRAGQNGATNQHAVKNGMGHVATGAITEDVRNALARVAATVHAHPDSSDTPSTHVHLGEDAPGLGGKLAADDAGSAVADQSELVSEPEGQHPAAIDATIDAPANTESAGGSNRTNRRKPRGKQARSAVAPNRVTDVEPNETLPVIPESADGNGREGTRLDVAGSEISVHHVLQSEAAAPVPEQTERLLTEALDALPPERGVRRRGARRRATSAGNVTPGQLPD